MLHLIEAQQLFVERIDEKRISVSLIYQPDSLYKTDKKSSLKDQEESNNKK